jgi:hypothetical protein
MVVIRELCFRVGTLRLFRNVVKTGVSVQANRKLDKICASGLVFMGA